jgi:hypothetical protein
MLATKLSGPIAVTGAMPSIEDIAAAIGSVAVTVFEAVDATSDAADVAADGARVLLNRAPNILFDSFEMFIFEF